MGSLSESHTQYKHGVEVEEDEEESYSRAMQLSMAIVLPMATQSAIQLGVFEIIAKAPGGRLSASEIATILQAQNPKAPVMLDRMLRLLVSHRVLDCSVSGPAGERLYGLTSVSKYFVPDQDGASLGNFMALPLDKVFMESWMGVKGAVMEGGIPFNRVHGMHIFEYASSNSKFSDTYHRAMFNHSTIALKRILEHYKGFENVTKLVDVGGGLGVTLSMIASKYPHIQAINFDLPHVVQDAASYPGVEHVGGNMFESVPEGDAILMKWILHCWDDEQCLRILKNCYKATPENGKVIVMNSVVPETPEVSSSARETSLLDVLLMTRDGGGRERTQKEFTELAIGAGFKGINFACCVCNLHIMEFFK
uniref:Anthranilate N-methyltransferase n=1 Tax=Ruta graveolens TaxID=37565 RepID=ANMT_RUTGR|nr:RecName: Full=Anthranilate N-methyltransferase; Short=RgANMT [Ruta graveolens]ABI93949.1 anthranilate N-methyltransferase [Ruta graveolens]